MRKTPLKKYNKKTIEKRKLEREGFAEFYQKHISIIKDKNLHCEGCGERLIGDVSEVAHILPKNFFKSICTEDKNIVYLCSWKSSNNCHGTFDNSKNEKVQEMGIFPKLQEIVKDLLKDVTEKINYKFYDRWQI